MNNLYAIYLRQTIITLILIFNSFIVTFTHAGTPIDPVFFQRMTYFEKEFIPSKLAENLSKNSLRDEQILSFYSKRGYTPFWYDDLESIQELSQAIKQTSAHGLPQMRYDFISEIGNIDIYDFEILAMESFFKLVTDLNSGLLEPSKVDSSISVYPEKIALGEVFLKISEPKFEKKSFVEKIYSFAPKSLEYTKLVSELERLRKVVNGDGWGDPVPENIFLGFMLKHPNVAKLRSRLHQMGYLAFDSESILYDEEIKAAIQLFQADHGLNDDGVAGTYTLQAINVSPHTRLIQVLVNLERIRWSNDEIEAKYVLVNQPNFQAYLFENDVITWQSRVVIGLPEHQTQEFSDKITHLIINPVWHVPRSISIDEYLPLIKENPEFLKENDMRLIVRGTSETIDPSLIDMSKFEPDNFPFLIKQNPSNINALGVVKFMFPNKFNIYMHDTPMKELFFKDERTFSHGCVRVQDPFQFAFKLLSPQERDPQSKFQKVLATKEERQINLVESVPVKITYRTVFLSDYGLPQYRSDIYGRDATVFMALQDMGVET